MSDHAIQAAFNHTSPHPLDARVRLTDDARDLIAVRSPEAAAVIWQRGENYKILTALDELAENPPRKQTSLYMPAIYSGIFGTWSFGSWEYGEPKWEWGLPKAIRQDIMDLHAAFKPVSLGYAVTKWEDSLFNRNTETSGIDEPHIDQDTSTGAMDVRLVASYTPNEGLTTEWYPGVHTLHQIKKIQSDFKIATDPEAFKESAGRQRLALGDVLILKGHHYGFKKIRPLRESLLHSIPSPRNDDVRLTYVATHIPRFFFL